MNRDISLKQVRKDAEDLFKAGKFYCSEAIMAAIRKNFDPSMPKEVIAMASGFPVGIGRSKCTCGAVSGGVLALGYFFGRTEGSSPLDPKSVKTIELAYELQDDFKKNHKVLCCSILTRGMDMAAKEHLNQCVAFTGEVAENTARIIIREKGLNNIDISEESDR